MATIRIPDKYIAILARAKDTSSTSFKSTSRGPSLRGSGNHWTDVWLLTHKCEKNGGERRLFL